MTWFGRGTQDWNTERRRLIFMIVGFAIALALVVWLFKYFESASFEQR